MIALTALYSSSMSMKFLLICGTKKVPIETHAATLVLRMLFRTLTFSGLDKTSTLLDAWSIKESHCKSVKLHSMRHVEETYSAIGKLHELLNELLLDWFVRLCGDHVPNCFIEGVNLLRGKVDGDRRKLSENFVDERLAFLSLQHDEVTSAFLSDLDERVARHVLDTYSISVRQCKRWMDKDYLRGSHA
jgi:hypothetical protein